MTFRNLANILSLIVIVMLSTMYHVSSACTCTSICLHVLLPHGDHHQYAGYFVSSHNDRVSFVQILLGPQQRKPCPCESVTSVDSRQKHMLQNHGAHSNHPYHVPWRQTQYSIQLTAQFQKKKTSCETQLIEFIDNIRKNIDNGKQTCMNFSKVFDKVDLLIHKLKHYNRQDNN